MRVRALCLGALTGLVLGPGAAAQEVPRVSLAEAVGWALERNPSTAVALAEVRRAQSLVDQTRTGAFPTLVGTGVLTVLDSPRQFGPVVSQPGTGVVASATLTVPILVPKPWAQWSQSKDQVEVAQASAADVRRVVATAVARAYLQIVARKRVIEAVTRARDNEKAHFDFAHLRLAGGIGNRIDEVRAEQQFQREEANVQTQWSNLAKEREALGVLVGVGGPLDAEEPNLQVNVSPAQAMADAEHRSDVAAVGAQLRAAEHVIRDTFWTDYSPYLTGTFTPFYSNPSTVNYPTTGWQAQLVLAIPFYDGGLRYGQQKERAVVRDEGRIQLEATLRQAKAEVRAAFEELQRADAALEASRRASDLGRRGLELAEIAYRAGATTNIEVIDAERTARDAEAAVAVAEDAARQARLDMLSATGRFP